jgi:hypothetical protein
VEQFGGLTISFRRLLYNLEHLCGCSVVVYDAGGIPDTDGSVSGAMYMVSRGKGESERYVFIEVHVEDLPVLPDHFASICTGLGISQDLAFGRIH